MTVDIETFLAHPWRDSERHPNMKHGESIGYHPNCREIFGVDRDGRNFWLQRVEKDLACRLLETRTPELVSSVLPTGDVLTWVLALSDRLVVASVGLDIDSIDKYRPLSGAIQPDRKGQVRLNDWRVSVGGRPMGGTMDVNCKEELGCFGMVDFDHTFIELADHRIVSNGFTTLKDGKTFLYVDSPKGLYRGELNEELAKLRLGDVINPLNKESLAGVLEPGVAGDFMVPDGLTWGSWKGREVLFVAIFNGGGVVIVDPWTGETIGVIKVDAPLVTSCCFGGPEFSTLFIVTSNEGLEVGQGGPNSGNIFYLNLASEGISGQPPNLLYLQRFFPDT